MRFWGWWRRNGNGARARAVKAEADLHRERRKTEQISAMADAISLDADEFADRVARAFQRRRA